MMSKNLIETRKSDVPEYLRCGKFFKTLNDEDDKISVPADTLKPNTIVESNDDLSYLLSSLRFWSVENTLREVVVYCLHKNQTSCSSVLEVFKNDFRYVDIIIQMIPLTDIERAKLAINSGLLELVQVLHESCCALSDGCHIAARAGHLHILQSVHQHGGKLDTLVMQQPIRKVAKSATYACACSHAAAGGHITCLQYLHEQGCPLICDTMSSAIYAGHTASVEYILQHIKAVRSVEFLRYLHENGCPWNVNTCIKAIERGYTDCLRYAHEHGCEWGNDFSYRAAESGQLECIKYAYKNGCSWDAKITFLAAQWGHLSCLQYALEQGCDVAVDAYGTSVDLGHTACAECLQAHRPDLGGEITTY